MCSSTSSNICIHPISRDHCTIFLHNWTRLSIVRLDVESGRRVTVSQCNRLDWHCSARLLCAPSHRSSSTAFQLDVLLLDLDSPWSWMAVPWSRKNKIHYWWVKDQSSDSISVNVSFFIVDFFQTVRTVNLNENRIGPEGAKYLADVLEVNHVGSLHLPFV